MKFNNKSYSEPQTVDFLMSKNQILGLLEFLNERFYNWSIQDVTFVGI